MSIAVAVAVLLALAGAAVLISSRRRAAPLVDRRASHQPENADTASLGQAILSAVSAEIAVLDANGVVQTTNAAWDHLLHSARNPVVSVPAGAMFEPGSELAGLAAAVHAVLRGERPEATVECSWEGPNGWQWSSVSVHRLHHTRAGAVVTHIDITRQKTAEATAERNVRELSHVNTLSVLAELSGSMAHELNQPLSAVLTNAHATRRLLRRDAPPLDEVSEALDDIISDTKRAAVIIERVRALFKRGYVELERVDLNRVVTDVLGLLDKMAAREGVSFQTDLVDGEIACTADRVQLQQVVINLVTNAIHASSGNRAKAPTVSVITRRERDAVQLMVRDSGSGIATDAMERIFDPFYTTKANGLGLGLTISRSIVEAHDGLLTAANLPAGGAELSLTLPCNGRV